ncbi:late competence development ComFB family protein [Cytobacillus sp. S13-E01]|uniref:late competence development ComFB family protein n=1 Tax=Cytobacillus sp. S13-E01 TaxID=3031326 RepID=UPI0023D7CE00|nr:late competence development ComFB family protein [Cytobacillus sp. S13-E01]MDF0726071.1 late competence development ComFB family protein [Cytobacillus sp. S13-E01]
MFVKNAMEPLVAEVINDNWQSIKMSCKCEQCRNDVFAITLNLLPSRYVSKKNGSAYVKAQYFDKQMQANILVKLAEATKRVSDQPQCENYLLNK